jgi:hypothetical protein
VAPVVDGLFVVDLLAQPVDELGRGPRQLALARVLKKKQKKYTHTQNKSQFSSEYLARGKIHKKEEAKHQTQTLKQRFTQWTCSSCIFSRIGVTNSSKAQ